MKRCLTVSFALIVGGIISVSAASQERKDSTAIDLQEIVVHGGRVIEKGDHAILFLSKENEKFGTSALDAISSLNRFQIGINTTGLTSYSGKDVFILIDGVPSDASRLYSLKGEDIRQVLYYDEPPAKYRTLTNNPVANIILRKRHDYNVNGYIRSNNNVRLPASMESLGAAYRDSLNMVSVDYDFFYTDRHDHNTQTDYSYANGNHTSERGIDNAFINTNQTVRGTYQRYEGSHLFNASANYRYGNTRSWMPYTLTSLLGKQTLTAEGGRNSKSRFDAVGLDFYYHLDLRNQQRLVFNITGGYTDSKYDNTVYRDMPGDATGTVPDESFHNHSLDKNKVYSAIAYAAYNRPMWSGQFSASARHEYKRLDQTTLFHKSKSEQNQTKVSAGMSWYKGFWYVSPSIGATVSDNRYECLHRTTVDPYVYLTGRLYGTGKLTGFQLGLNAYLLTNQPPIALTDNSTVYLDKSLVSVGNPDLRSQLQQDVTLQLSYFSPNGRNYAMLQIANQHFFNAIGTVLSVRDGLVWRQPRNIGDNNYLGISIGGRYSPATWLYICPSVTMQNYHYDTPSNRIRKTFLTAGGSVIFNFWKCNITLGGNAPTRQYDGDYVTKNNGTVIGQFMFIHHNFSAGIAYNYTWNSRMEGQCAGFTERRTDYFRMNRNAVAVMINWAFSQGRARNHDSKAVNNSTFESGLRN